ncbi:MAG: hypothetical protein LBC40_03675 [Dysgonamonadaceae bacterium]|jgi:hypothetical protein|nr:hypothetical protein [Dysgonamonadaceae bacterium]
MKRFFYIFLLILFISCNNGEKSARTELQKAQDFYDKQEYSSARQTLDSLKIKYPKAFPVLKEGQQLVKKIEYALQTRNLQYCNSMIPVKLAEVEPLKQGFTFEKDAEYEDLGKYVYQSQSIEKNVQKSYIRCHVNELGEMTLFSVYYGAKPIRHTALRVSSDTGESAQTETVAPDGSNNYTFADGGMTTETVGYAKGKDNGVILFICNNAKEHVKALFLGEKEIAFTVSEAGKTAVVKTYNLAVALSEIEKLKKERDIAKLKLEYLESQI